ncbi:MAG: hypothetical protein ACOC0A_00210 [Planctomycetota bacterium]
MVQKQAIRITKSILESKTVAFRGELGQINGCGVCEALFLSEVMYWAGRSKDDWAYRTQEELQKDTLLSPKQQLRVREFWRDLGILHEDKRGIPARLYYRIDWERLAELFSPNRLDMADNGEENKYPPSGDTGYDDSAEQDTPEGGNQSQQFVGAINAAKDPENDRKITTREKDVLPSTYEDPLAYMQDDDGVIEDAVECYRATWKKPGYKPTTRTRNQIMARHRHFESRQLPPEYEGRPVQYVIRKAHCLYDAGDGDQFYGDNSALSALTGEKMFERIFEAPEPDSLETRSAEKEMPEHLRM